MKFRGMRSTKACVWVLRVLAGLPLCATAQTHSCPETMIWFDTPATNFTESTPLGNRWLGAMMFGGVKGKGENFFLGQTGFPGQAIESGQHAIQFALRRKEILIDVFGLLVGKPLDFLDDFVGAHGWNFLDAVDKSKPEIERGRTFTQSTCQPGVAAIVDRVGDAEE
jgi:hypothetical protein